MILINTKKEKEIDVDELEFLKGVYEVLGIWGLGAVSIIIAVFKFPYLRKTFFGYLIYTYKQDDDPKVQYTILQQQLKYWQQSKGSILVFEDKARQAIFQDLTHIKINVYSKYVTEFYNNIEKFRNGVEMYDFILDSFQNIIEEIEAKQKLEGIPNQAIEKYLLWQRPSHQYTLGQMRNITFSKAYASINQKAEVIINTFQTNIELSFFEAERTLSTLNGSLTGAEYKGYICGSLKN